MTQKYIMTSDELLTSLITSDTYDFCNIQTEKSKYYNMVQANYQICLDRMNGSNTKLESSIQLKYNKSTAISEIVISVNLKNIDEISNDKLILELPDEINSLDYIEKNKLKISINDNILTIETKAKCFPDIFEYNISILAKTVAECISITDKIIIQTLHKYMPDIAELEVYYPYNKFQCREITDEIYDRVYIPKVQSSWSYTYLELIETITIPAFKETDFIVNLTPDKLNVIRTEELMCFTNPLNMELEVNIAYDDETGEINAFTVGKHVYFGVNGVYTEDKTNKITLGRFMIDENGTECFVPFTIKSQKIDYNGLCILHVTEDDYLARKTLANM